MTLSATTSNEPYPLFSAEGTPRELGRQHGEQARERIRGYLDFLTASLKLTEGALQSRALRFEFLFKETCPSLLDEVAGLAEGAAIPFSSALALQMRGELGQVSDSACTTFVLGPHATVSGQILIGQTSDNPAELEQFGYGLRIQPRDKPAVLMWTFGGMLGYHGLNAHGVAHFANSLGGGPGWKFALSHYPLKRLILEQRTLDDVRQLLRQVPVCSNGNYVLCDGQGQIADIELTSDGPFEVPSEGAPFLVHSNHYLCGEHACDANFEQSLPDSFPRLTRMRELIEQKAPQVTVADMQRILSDHEGHPTSICRHPHVGPDYAVLPSAGKTVVALIAEPQQGRLHVARGNACENPFTTWSL